MGRTVVPASSVWQQSTSLSAPRNPWWSAGWVSCSCLSMNGRLVSNDPSRAAWLPSLGPVFSGGDSEQVPGASGGQSRLRTHRLHWTLHCWREQVSWLTHIPGREDRLPRLLRAGGSRWDTAFRVMVKECTWSQSWKRARLATCVPLGRPEIGMPRVRWVSRSAL